MPQQLERFEREARTAAGLHHTNIVPIFGVGQHEGYHFIVMQYIRGVGLDVVLSRAAAGWLALDGTGATGELLETTAGREW